PGPAWAPAAEPAPGAHAGPGQGPEPAPAPERKSAREPEPEPEPEPVTAAEPDEGAVLPGPAGRADTAPRGGAAPAGGGGQDGGRQGGRVVASGGAPSLVEAPGVHGVGPGEALAAGGVAPRPASLDATAPAPRPLVAERRAWGISPQERDVALAPQIAPPEASLPGLPSSRARARTSAPADGTAADGVPAGPHTADWMLASGLALLVLSGAGCAGQIAARRRRPAAASASPRQPERRDGRG
ncbi:MAG TPA: hypothetical protein VM324_15955, partial [Egibacteraceae bacterium]|nr:hypothetical protein [Egibacteraceae bacterium]